MIVRPSMVGVGKTIEYPGASLICSSKITLIRAGDTTRAL